MGGESHAEAFSRASAQSSWPSGTTAVKVCKVYKAEGFKGLGVQGFRGLGFRVGAPIVVSCGAASAALQSGLTYRMPGRERV